HANPRGTRVCSKCGSAELSTPQPRVPLWATILPFLLMLISGLILVLISVGLVAFFVERFLFSYDMLFGLIAMGFVLVVLWWGWTQVPIFFRKTLRQFLQRHGNDDRE